MRVPSSMPAGMLTRERARLGDAARAGAFRAGVATPPRRGRGRSGRCARCGRSRPGWRAPGRRRRRSGRSSGWCRAWRRSPSRDSQVTLVGTSTSTVLPAIGLLERDLEVVAEVGAALAAAERRPPPPEVAEELVEDVGEGGEAGAAPRRRRSRRLLEGLMAEAVVGGALLRVLQDLVGFVDFLELQLGGAGRRRCGRDGAAWRACGRRPSAPSSSHPRATPRTS